jgi:hypothetical protein
MIFKVYLKGVHDNKENTKPWQAVQRCRVDSGASFAYLGAAVAEVCNLSALAGATAVGFYTSKKIVTASALQVTSYSLFGAVLDFIILLVEGSCSGQRMLDSS